MKKGSPSMLRLFVSTQMRTQNRSALCWYRLRAVQGFTEFPNGPGPCLVALSEPEKCFHVSWRRSDARRDLSGSLLLLQVVVSCMPLSRNHFRATCFSRFHVSKRPLRSIIPSSDRRQASEGLFSNSDEQCRGGSEAGLRPGAGRAVPRGHAETKRPAGQKPDGANFRRGGKGREPFLFIWGGRRLKSMLVN